MTVKELIENKIGNRHLQLFCQRGDRKNDMEATQK
jgi:hypothetical protein